MLRTHARTTAATAAGNGQAASLRLQTLAKGAELLASLPVLGDADSDEVFTPQAVAVIVTAYQRMGLRDDALFRALVGVVKALPAEDFDAQALSSIANSYVANGVQDEEMFRQLAKTASVLTAERWNPTAVALFTNALVQTGMTEAAEDKALLHDLAEVQCAMYASQGAGVFSSSGNLAKLLSGMVQARVHHVRLFTAASVVVGQHLRLASRDKAGGSNILLPKGKVSAKNKDARYARQKEPCKRALFNAKETYYSLTHTPHKRAL